MSIVTDCKNSSECETVTSIFLDLVDGNSTGSLFETDALLDFAKGVGRMFYIVNPAETTFENPKDVPNFFRNVSLRNNDITRFLI